MGTGGLKILVAEDDTVAREQICEIFLNKGHTVFCAKDGEEAWSSYIHGAYDLVVTDIKMPKMDGIELIKRINIVNPNAHIIVMSAYNDPDTLIHLINIGVEHFILKPISPELMIKKIGVIKKSISRDKALSDYQELLRRRNMELEEKTQKLERSLRIAVSKLRQNSLILNKAIIEKKPKKESEPINERVIDYMLEDHIDDLNELEESIDSKANLLALSSEGVREDMLHVIAKDVGKYGDILVNYSRTEEIGVNMIELGSGLKIYSTQSKEQTTMVIDYLESFAFTLSKWREHLFDLKSKEPHLLDNSIICDIKTVVSALKGEAVENLIEFF